jgi:hypothetical protein
MIRRRYLSAYAALPAEEKAELWRSWFLILLAKLIAPQLGVGRTVQINERLLALATGQPVAAERVAELVEVAGRRFPRGSTCLERAIALVALLRRGNHRAKLAIGVRRHGHAHRDFAHAWVEVDSSRRLAGQPADGLFVRVHEF